jgi:hypothetical protein
MRVSGHIELEEDADTAPGLVSVDVKADAQSSDRIACGGIAIIRLI